MAPRLTRRDRALLLATLPLFAAAFGLHVHETARSGLAQLPVYADSGFIKVTQRRIP